MAAGSQEFVVRLLADVSKFAKGMEAAEQHTSKFDRAMERLGKAAAIGFAVGGAAAVKFGKDAFDALIESQKASAQTEAVIKSMGLASVVTSQQIGELATSISRKTGIDDEAIRSASNLLLTFSEVAASTETLNQATRLSADLSVAWGMDVDQAAKMVGKALQDPIAGLTALRRVGVTFTEDQQQAIKAMVDTGDAAGAQKAILAELTKQVGGSAEAFGTTLAGKLGIARERFEDIQVAIAEKLLPWGEKALGWVTRLLEQIGLLTDDVDNSTQKITSMGETLATLGGTARFAADLVGGFTDTIRAAASWMGETSVTIETLIGRWIGWWEEFGGRVADVWGGIKEGAKAGLNAIVDRINDVIRMVNKVIPILSKIPGVDIDPIAAIPRLAHGGPLAAGQLALVGERGPELFVSDSAGRVIPNDRLIPSGGRGIGGEMSVTINVSGAGDPRAVALAVRDELLRLQRRNVTTALA